MPAASCVPPTTCRSDAVDILLLALANVDHDARTRNVARALARNGYRVGVVADGTPVGDGITMYRWDDPGGSARRRWLSFTQHVARLHLRPRAVAAMDLFALPAASRLARRCAAPLAYDAREFYFALGPLGGRGLRQRLLAAAERHYIARADMVTVSGPLDADILAERYALPRRPVVILNTPPYADAAPSGRLRQQHGIPAGATVLLYQGVVHHGRGLEPVMRAMATMPDAHTVVLGDGPARPALAATADRLGVASRMHWHGSVPYDELHDWTCGADIGLCLIEPVSLSYAYALPNKFFEYMRARRPQLVSDLPALRAMVDRYPVGMLVDPALAAADIVEAIRQIRLPATYRAFVEQCEAIHELSFERQQTVVVDCYTALLESRP